MTTSAFESLQNYIDSTLFAQATPHSDLNGANNTAGTPRPGSQEYLQALRDAYAHANEYAIPAPDAATGQLLTTITAASTAQTVDKPQVIAITPATSVAGLFLLAGLPENGILSCVDPEAEHQASAKAAFRTAGFKPSTIRFLPAQPLDVMGRLAEDAYQVIFAEVPLLDGQAIIKASWPLLQRGGSLILANTLLDGTIADASRTDRATVAARELDAFVSQLEGAIVTRLPLGAGLTIVTKTAQA